MYEVRLGGGFLLYGYRECSAKHTTQHTAVDKTMDGMRAIPMATRPRGNRKSHQSFVTGEVVGV